MRDCEPTPCALGGRVNVAIVNDAVGLMHDAVHAVRQRVGEREGSGGGAGGATGGRPSAMAIGHAGVGGSIGLCIPERRVALAITVSKLSGGRTATKKILELLLAEVGLAAPVGL